MKTKELNLTLEVRYRKPEYTIGRLLVDGVYLCDTLEDKDRDLNRDGDLNDAGEGKVFGETAIPYGRYEVILTKSPKFGRYLPLLVRVPHFEGVRMHRGVNAEHTRGCILVGENKVKGGLVNSAKYELMIVEIILEAIKSGKKVYLEKI